MRILLDINVLITYITQREDKLSEIAIVNPTEFVRIEAGEGND